MNDESAEKYLEATIRQQPRLWLIDKNETADISAVPPKRDSLISVCTHVKVGYLLISGPI